MRKTTATLAFILAAVAGTALWHTAWQAMPPAEPVAQAPLKPPAHPASAAGADTAPAPAAQAEPAPAPQARVEEVEPADTESLLERFLPRRSAGHAAGLHKTEDPLDLGSSAALVLDANTREVVFNKNEQAVLPIASITKLMTGLVIAEARLPMWEVLTITEEDVDVERHSSSRLKVGTLLSRDEALHLALMSSENRAAHALGRSWPQGLPAFVAAMNKRAQELGMTNTRYVDPTGLSNGNRSSARDLAALALAASRQKVLRDYSTTQQHLFQAGTRTLRYSNSNRLVKNPRWDIALQKTGYIVEAGHCVVMRTQVAGRDLVMVLLDASDNGARSADADRIRHWLDPAAAQLEREMDKLAKRKGGKKVTAKASGKNQVRKEGGRVRRSFSREGRSP